MLAPNTKQHALGVSRAGNGTRIWLEGKRLAANGFAHGTQCERVWSAGRLLVRPIDSVTFDALERDCRSTIAGTPARPILDITGLQVARAFPSGSVLVTWSQGSISIEGV